MPRSCPGSSARRRSPRSSPATSGRPSSWRGCEPVRWLWAGANGVVTDLTLWAGGSYVLGDGITGQVAPVYDFATQATAGIDGEQVQQVPPQAVVVVLPIDFV